jgi:hypothetical protein
MADIRRITIVPKRPSLFGALIRQSLVWVLLVGAIGVSKTWFGGSWVIDFFALLIGLVAILAIGQRLADTNVDMTKDDLARWVAAGQPDDIKAWRGRV